MVLFVFVVAFGVLIGRVEKQHLSYLEHRECLAGMVGYVKDGYE